GMNTLLHAPLQASVQQAEWHDADRAVQRTNRHDTTLLFSEENEMDMTASHTAVIARNLRSSQAGKIDITSFLAGLNPNRGEAEESQGFHFFSDPTSHLCPSLEQKEDAPTVKKIDFNEFLMSLKSNTPAPHPVEGPGEENVFSVPSQASADTAPAAVESAYSQEPLDTCNVTKVFREEEDGMEMTRTRSAIPGSISSETVFRGDKTVFSKCDDMEITGNYTDIICDDSAKETNSCQNSDRQEKTHAMKRVKVLPTRVGSEGDFSMGKAASSEEDVTNPPSVGGLHWGAAGEPLPPQMSEAQKRSSQLPSYLEKSVVFPSGENMDLTGNCAVMVPDHTSTALSERKAAPGHLDMEMTTAQTAALRGAITVQDREPIPADKTLVFTPSHDDMEITASHTVAVNDNANG
ncbi:KNL1 protein, partial [Hemiprocne comata]|nr:KNL1 protein [Hemiprocne comata]